MIKRTLVIAALFTLFTSQAQEQNPFYIGHSLVNHNMPAMVQGLAIDAGKTTHYGLQLINGSPLGWNLENHANAEGTSYQAAFPDGSFNTLIITEAVPLQNHLTWSDTYVHANSFHNYANNNNNGVPVRFYIYETWHCINSGIPQPDYPTGCAYDDSENSHTLWHPRLLLDFPLWSGIVTHVRDQNPADNEIWMVPAGQALYNLTTQINNGNLPGITSFTDLFSDDIHLSNAGNYFVACVMYATIYRQSPVGLTSSINDQWGNPFTDMPSTAQALVMQEVAWSTVTELNDWTGVSSSLSHQDYNLKKQVPVIYPNPSSDYITIDTKDFNEVEEIQIYNSIGILIEEVSIINNKTLNITDLAEGLYFISFKNSPSKTLKFIKKK